jgi:hypothetical protein
MLLRVSPSQSPASVLSPHGFHRLCFSLGIGGLVPAVPHVSLCPLHAPYTPTADYPVIRHPVVFSQGQDAPLVSTTSSGLRRVIEGSLAFVSRTRTCARSCLDAFLQRSPPCLLSTAAWSGLRPAPESRSRGARPHLPCSFHASSVVHAELPPMRLLQHTILKPNLDRGFRCELAHGLGDARRKVFFLNVGIACSS